MVLSQEAHIINILPPQSIEGAVTSDVFSMKDASHATIIVTCGATDADAGNVTIEECDDFTPTNDTAIAFKYAAETTAAGDTLGALTAATTAGIDVSANDNITYVIEIDAEDLSEGFNNLILKWSAPGGATLVSAVAVLTGLSYQGDQNRTQIA
jgi:hypothetical protein